MEFNKRDLKDGMVVVNREGDKYLVINGCLRKYGKYSCLYNYYDDLISLVSTRLDIVKVFKANETGTIQDLLNPVSNIESYAEKIWERVEKKWQKVSYIQAVKDYRNDITVKSVKEGTGYRTIYSKKENYEHDVINGTCCMVDEEGDSPTLNEMLCDDYEWFAFK